VPNPTLLLRRPRGRSIIALTLLGCTILGVGAYSLAIEQRSAPASRLDPGVDGTPDLSGHSAPSARKVIQDRVVSKTTGETAEQLSTVQSSPEWATPSLMTSGSPPKAPNLDADPLGHVSGLPRRVRTLTIDRKDGNLDGGLLDVTSSSSATTGLAFNPQRIQSQPASQPRTGGFLVQLSAMRTEAQAQASFRSMRAKYPGSLSGRSPIIKRAENRGKGMLYRTSVGPFTSVADAGEFCSTLKRAGGQCSVQKNR
jgi:SPOR domain